MTTWLTSKNRKRHQRAFNKIMRQINESIENDNLWQGRFYVRQTAAQWYIYPDNSGAELIVRFCFYDKVTGITRAYVGTVNDLRMLNGFRLWYLINDFIIEEVKV